MPLMDPFAVALMAKMSADAAAGRALPTTKDAYHKRHAEFRQAVARSSTWLVLKKRTETLFLLRRNGFVWVQPEGALDWKPKASTYWQHPDAEKMLKRLAGSLGRHPAPTANHAAAASAAAAAAAALLAEQEGDGDSADEDAPPPLASDSSDDEEEEEEEGEEGEGEEDEGQQPQQLNQHNNTTQLPLHTGGGGGGGEDAVAARAGALHPAPAAGPAPGRSMPPTFAPAAPHTASNVLAPATAAAVAEALAQLRQASPASPAFPACVTLAATDRRLVLATPTGQMAILVDLERLPAAEVAPILGPLLSDETLLKVTLQAAGLAAVLHALGLPPPVAVVDAQLACELLRLAPAMTPLATLAAAVTATPPELRPTPGLPPALHEAQVLAALAHALLQRLQAADSLATAVSLSQQRTAAGPTMLGGHPVGFEPSMSGGPLTLRSLELLQTMPPNVAGSIQSAIRLQIDDSNMSAILHLLPPGWADAVLHHASKLGPDHVLQGVRADLQARPVAIFRQTAVWEDQQDGRQPTTRPRGLQSVFLFPTAPDRVTSMEDLGRMEAQVPWPAPGAHSASLPGSLHRVARLRAPGPVPNAPPHVVGLTVTARRHVLGCADVLGDLLTRGGGGLLVAGPPGSGKTTLLRDAVRYLTRPPPGSPANATPPPHLLVVDTLGHITTSLPAPPPYLAAARRLFVPVLGTSQADTISSAVHAHRPEMLVVDVVSDPLEVAALVTARQRGVQVLCGVQGSLEELLRDESRRLLLGAVRTPGETTGIPGAPRRVGNPICQSMVICSLDGSEWTVVPDVAQALDSYLAGEPIAVQRRWVDGRSGRVFVQAAFVTCGGAPGSR